MKTNLLLVALIFICLYSCKKDDPTPTLTLNSTSLTLFSNGTNQLVVNNATTEKFTYTSGNNLIAAVDDKGLITAKRVGETNIKVSGNGFNGECNITINPLYNTFIEPITSFGITKSEVKAKEKRMIYTENETIIIYEGSKKEKYAAYFFENGKLKNSAAIVSSAYSSELGNYMAERYYIVSIDPVFGYSVDDKFLVMTSLNDDLDWFVFYGPHDEKSASLQSKSISLKTMYQSELKNLIIK